MCREVLFALSALMGVFFLLGLRAMFRIYGEPTSPTGAGGSAVVSVLAPLFAGGVFLASALYLC